VRAIERELPGDGIEDAKHGTRVQRDAGARLRRQPERAPVDVAKGMLQPQRELRCVARLFEHEEQTVAMRLRRHRHVRERIQHALAGAEERVGEHRRVLLRHPRKGR